ncbi:hypothetical protein SNE40_014164 [Patella caerulea]|uniref:Uncharacterized protein n=1 Tax=Patella caerulea TaxID=87958 RepID=A0AAN8JD20_PATCE
MKNNQKLSSLWHCDAENIIKNQEDSDFLKSMKTDRKASIAGMDMVTLAKEQRCQERMRSSEKRREKCETLSKAQFSEAVLADSSCSDNERPLATVNPDTKPNKRSHERTAKSGTEA